MKRERVKLQWTISQIMVSRHFSVKLSLPSILSLKKLVGLESLEKIFR